MVSLTDPTPRNRYTGSIIKVMVVAAAALVLVVGAQHGDLQKLLRDVMAWIAGFGAMGLLIFVALYIVCCVLLIPGAFLTLGAGVIFGVVNGTLAASIGATLGATVAFVLGRYLTRDWVANRIAGSQRFRSVDAAVADEGWKIIFLARLSPVFPFVLINYAFGLTKVRLGHYFWASWLGMLPSTVMYVYLGSLAGDLASLDAGGQTRTPGEWILTGVGLLATIAVTVFVTRLARRALAERIRPKGAC